MSITTWLLAPTDKLGTIIAASSAAVLGSLFVGFGIWFNLRQWRAEAAPGRHQEVETRRANFHTPETRAAIMMLFNYERIIPLVDEMEPVKWDEVQVALIPALYRQVSAAST